MDIKPKFPAGRVGLPMRRAEHQIYQLLAHSDVPGRALYEARALPHGRQIDFAVWIEGVGRFAAEVKGGIRDIDDRGEWRVFADGGWRRKESAVAQAWDAAMSIPELIERRLRRKVYIIAVLALPDMEADQAIVDAAARQHVEVLFGSDRWVERLVDLAAPRGILRPPTRGQIEEEEALVMPELAAPSTQPQLAARGAQVVIHRVDQLHLHVGPEGLQALDGLTDTG